MADNDSNWFNRKIDPLPKKKDGDVDDIKDQLQQLHDQKAKDSAQPKSSDRLIDTFWRDHGHHPDQEAAWHRFYSSLNTDQKQQVWDEYHNITFHSGDEPITQEPKVKPIATAYKDFPIPSEGEKIDISANVQKEAKKARQTKSDSVADTKDVLLKKLKGGSNKDRVKMHLKPFISAGIAMILVLSINYNQLVIAQVKQFVSPGNSLSGPSIVDPNATIDIGPESRIIIPKINVDVPVVYDETSYNEDAIQAALERGVVHYGTTAEPGEPGNNVIVGHSSNNFLNSGKYKFAFVLLDRLDIGDTFILHFESTRYVYKVTKKQVIEPTDFSLIQPTAVPTTTLITCTPPGTSWRRLVVQAEQISPTPNDKKPANTQIEPTSDEGEVIVPGNSPSLWSRLTGWLFDD